MIAAYRTSPLQRRKRPTNVELAALDAAIVTAVSTETPVTVRGVFYRVVSAGAVEKTEKGYSAVQRRLLHLRRTSAIPYSSITDGTRLRLKPDSWDGVEQMLSDVASSYRRALWNDQAAEVIVIPEKDAISGVVYPVTAEYDVELCITRGYSSETFTHSIAQTVADNSSAWKTTFVYQLGDHDPSGVDAWRSFGERVRAFAPRADVEFERIAVTPDQITAMNLPTRPTKGSDANPLGLVLVAVGALTAGLIVAYKKSETFRKIVDGAFGFVKAAATSMWEDGIRPAAHFIKGAFDGIGSAVVSMWDGFIRPTLRTFIDGYRALPVASSAPPARSLGHSG